MDDGACDHLVGATLPPIALSSTSARMVRLDQESAGTWVVVYAYPRTGRPEDEPPPGWNLIPGARGCTPQSCGFRDVHAELQALGVKVFGLSTQDTTYQSEMAQRPHLPFDVLSDEGLLLTTALRLPTFAVAGMTLLKRVTLVFKDGVIEKVFYPVFPPDANASEVLTWMASAG